MSAVGAPQHLAGTATDGVPGVGTRFELTTSSAGFSLTKPHRNTGSLSFWSLRSSTQIPQSLEGNLMARRDGTKGARNSGNPKVRRCGVVLGGAVGAFVAAAAMATGSAAPAKADSDDCLDPSIQPILPQVTESLA